MSDELWSARVHAVEWLDGCTLCVGAGDWPFARANTAAIDAHWEQKRAASPAMFNGRIFILGSGAVRNRVLTGSLMGTDFKSFLYWKDHDYPDHSVRDVFGSALIRSSEGHIILGRQAAGNLNAGLAYLPGGFIDPRDVDSEGRVALEASVMREAAEETGLDERLLRREPGLVLTRTGMMTSLAVPFRSPLGSQELATMIRGHITADPASELSEIVVVRGTEDLAGLKMPIYASVLLAHLLARP